MEITLESLAVLDAIARRGSFAGAAQELHKAQSAISYGVRQLEASLGLPLFDRRGYRATLTPAGQAVLEEARGVLLRAERLEGLAGRFREGWEPRLSVIVDGVLPMEPIMRVLKRMAEEEVPTRIQLKVEFLGGVQDRFESDAADLMLVKDYTRAPHLLAHALSEVTCVLVVSREHPLASAKSLALPDLRAHIELTVHDSSVSKRLEDTQLFGGPRVFYLSDFNTKKQGLMMGLGFGWMPLYLVQRELEEGALVELRYRPGSRFSFVPSLVHPATRPLGRAGRRFLDLLTAPAEGLAEG